MNDMIRCKLSGRWCHIQDWENVYSDEAKEICERYVRSDTVQPPKKCMDRCCIVGRICDTCLYVLPQNPWEAGECPEDADTCTNDDCEFIKYRPSTID